MIKIDTKLFARLKNEINDVPPPQYTCLSLNKFVEDIVNEYSLDIPVLEIVIDKLNRNHSEEELYLEKLQNTILQHILEQELTLQVYPSQNKKLKL